MTGPSAGDLRAALRSVLPGLTCETVAVRGEPGRQTDPTWQSGSALVDGAFVAKFAWSQVAADRLRREGQILNAPHAAAPHLRLPEVVAIGTEPVLLVTRVVRGGPLTGTEKAALDNADADRVAADLASFLAGLHEPAVLEQLRQSARTLPPAPQAETSALRRRFGRWVWDLQAPALRAVVDFVRARPSSTLAT